MRINGGEPSCFCTRPGGLHETIWSGTGPADCSSDCTLGNPHACGGNAVAVSLSSDEYGPFCHCDQCQQRWTGAACDERIEYDLWFIPDSKRSLCLQDGFGPAGWRRPALHDVASGEFWTLEANGYGELCVRLAPLYPFVICLDIAFLFIGAGLCIPLRRRLAQRSVSVEGADPLQNIYSVSAEGLDCLLDWLCFFTVLHTSGFEFRNDPQQIFMYAMLLTIALSSQLFLLEAVLYVVCIGSGKRGGRSLAAQVWHRFYYLVVRILLEDVLLATMYLLLSLSQMAAVAPSAAVVVGYDTALVATALATLQKAIATSAKLCRLLKPASTQPTADPKLAYQRLKDDAIDASMQTLRSPPSTEGRIGPDDPRLTIDLRLLDA